MKRFIAIVLLTFFLVVPSACAQNTNSNSNSTTATFAGGCFWCMESDFDKVDGVLSTTSGYIGGKLDNPTYKQVSRGKTGHAESVEVEYDPTKVSYQQLLDTFWVNVDPTVKNRQFCDIGSQYRTAIFYHNDQQKQLALASKKKIQDKLNTKVFTEIVSATKFYSAEGYHQDYYLKNPLKYKYYRFACGRDKRLTELWGESATH